MTPQQLALLAAFKGDPAVGASIRRVAKLIGVLMRTVPTGAPIEQQASHVSAHYIAFAVAFEALGSVLPSALRADLDAVVVPELCEKYRALFGAPESTGGMN